MNVPEKRRAKRRRTVNTLEIYNEDGWEVLGVGRLLDFSASGALIESLLHLPLGETFRLGVRLPNKPPLELTVRVVRMRQKQSSILYGVQFVHLPGAQGIAA